jgi:hypothetical protein
MTVCYEKYKEGNETRVCNLLKQCKDVDRNYIVSLVSFMSEKLHYLEEKLFLITVYKGRINVYLFSVMFHIFGNVTIIGYVFSYPS